jgi:hypothetical protein
LQKVSAPQCNIALKRPSEVSVSRFKNTIQIGLVAVVLMLAAGTPAHAKVVVRHDRPQINSSSAPRSSVRPSFFKRFSAQLKRLTRYAMAAN